MSNHTPQSSKVAVITRTKDRPLLLERAILSIHNQTFDDFVHVIINDAGDINAVEKLVDKYQSLIKGRVKIIDNKISNGMEAASNKAIKSVDSIYVAIHDDDDTWHSEFLEKTVTHLEASKSKGVVVVTDKIDEEITNGEIKQLSINRWLPEVRVINLYRQCLDNYVTPITFLYERKVYDTIGYYDESLPVAGDWDFGLRFLMEYDIDFLVTKFALANYHHRPNADGTDKNSVFVDKGLLHEQKINLIANKYLREELKTGKLGLGYIINSLKSDNDTKMQIMDKISSTHQQYTTRIEGHINYVNDQIMKEVKQSSIRNFLRNTFTIKNSTKR